MRKFNTCANTREKLYILVFSNDLSLPSMDNKLIPPFIMREADLVVKDKAKNHAMDSSAEEHRIYFPNF